MTKDDGDGLWYSTNFKKSDDDRPLYASLKRPPLTKKEIETAKEMETAYVLQFARAIEAAHGIGDKT